MTSRILIGWTWKLLVGHWRSRRCHRGYRGSQGGQSGIDLVRRDQAFDLQALSRPEELVQFVLWHENLSRVHVRDQMVEDVAVTPFKTKIGCRLSKAKSRSRK